MKSSLMVEADKGCTRHKDNQLKLKKKKSEEEKWEETEMWGTRER